MSDGVARNDRERSIKWLLIFSVVTYVASLCVPAYDTDMYGRPQPHWGLEALLLGPIGLFAGHFSWLANPALWIAWLRLKRRKSGGTRLSLLGAALALTFLFSERIAVGSAGEFAYSVGIGYVLWVAAMISAALAGILRGRQLHQKVAVAGAP